MQKKAKTPVAKSPMQADAFALAAAFMAAKSAATRGSQNLVGFNAEQEFPLTPLLPANLLDMNAFRAPWRRSGTDLYRRCRELNMDNDFIEGVNRIKESYFAQGFHVVRNTDAVEDFLATDDGAALNRLLHQLSDDVWSEWLTCEAAVAYWQRPETGGYPKVTILDCENVEYSYVLGVEKLQVTPAQIKLTKNQKNELGARFADALEKGKPITLDRRKGECWQILKRGKRGSSGLGTPSLKAVMDIISQRELLKIADWAGSWTHKDVIRHIKKGHEITQGSLAGQPIYFLNTPQKNRIIAQNKNKGGAYMVISNFDLNYEFVFFDPKFFDAKKYEGVMAHLTKWAGALGRIYEGGLVSPYLMKMFEQEGLRSRERVSRFIESIVSDPDFAPDMEIPELKVAYNPHAFKSAQEILDWVRVASNGVASPQTQRRALGLDDATESRLMRKAHEAKADYTPPFEPRQGLLNGGDGRPPKGQASHVTVDRPPA
jgi:hypothetical protein